MKIVVDTMPKKSSDCIFSEYEGFELCKLKRCPSDLCDLSLNEPCKQLLPMNGMEFIVNQMKYGR